MNASVMDKIEVRATGAISLDQTVIPAKLSLLYFMTSCLGKVVKSSRPLSVTMKD